VLAMRQPAGRFRCYRGNPTCGGGQCLTSRVLKTTTKRATKF
jgi:hypothetical protein